MPQLNTVVLNDAAATPVAHSFVPRGIDQGVTTLVESAGSPLGEKRLTLSQNRSQNGRVRPIIKLAVPVVQDSVINGITKPTVVKTNYVDITFNFDPASTTQERKDMVKFVNELCSSTKTDLQAYIVDLQGYY